MACDSRRPPGMTPEQRAKQIQDAIADLDAALASLKVTVKVGPQGALAFSGEWQRNGISDVCAYRRLSAKGSEALRRAVARAEALAGRKMDARQIAAGVHSHDGGNSWGKH